jgi:aminopeptidase N/puromycin-sensitive aminopeptidase
MNAVRMAGAGLEYVSDHIASTPEERAKLAAFVRAHFAASYRNLGAPQANDSTTRRELRAELLEILAGAGQDTEAISNAKAIAAKSLAEQGSVDPTLEEAALHVAARHGDAPLFDQLQKLSESAANPQVKASALHALALFEDPVLAQRALEFAASGQVRNQDAASLLGVELENQVTQELAWTFIQHNWDKVMAQVTTESGSSLVGATGSFCSSDKIAQISSFFAEHKVPASARALARAKDDIGDCVDLRAAQEANFKVWLAKQ